IGSDRVGLIGGDEGGIRHNGSALRRDHDVYGGGGGVGHGSELTSHCVRCLRTGSHVCDNRNELQGRGKHIHHSHVSGARRTVVGGDQGVGEQITLRHRARRRALDKGNVRVGACAHRDIGGGAVIGQS